MLLVTLSQITSSKQCAKVVLQNPKNLEFPECLSCMTFSSLTHRD
nr:probable chromatin-remodeling complex ATPase chain [Ipomoea batatas]